MVVIVKVSSCYGNQLTHCMYSHAAADQPLLHKIMWDNRSCDTVSRPVKKLSHHFAQLLDSYHNNKVSEITR